MDPISLILAGLAAGAIAGTQGVASEAVADMYKGLKTLVQRKLVGNSDAEFILAKYEENPKKWEELLKAELVDVAADKDEQIVEEARKVVTLTQTQIGSQTNYYGSIGSMVSGNSGGTNIHTQNVHYHQGVKKNQN